MYHEKEERISPFGTRPRTYSAAMIARRYEKVVLLIVENPRKPPSCNGKGLINEMNKKEKNQRRGSYTDEGAARLDKQRNVIDVFNDFE